MKKALLVAIAVLMAFVAPTFAGDDPISEISEVQLDGVVTAVASPPSSLVIQAAVKLPDSNNTQMMTFKINLTRDTKVFLNDKDISGDMVAITKALQVKTAAGVVGAVAAGGNPTELVAEKLMLKGPTTSGEYKSPKG